jgi:hypothetical protein
VAQQFEHQPGDGHVCERAQEHCTHCCARLVPADDPAAIHADPIASVRTACEYIKQQYTGPQPAHGYGGGAQ